jgi:hypothetical protein
MSRQRAFVPAIRAFVRSSKIAHKPVLGLWFTKNKIPVMDRRQQNRYDMFVATHRFLQEHQSEWPGDAMMLTTVGKLKALIDDIGATNSLRVNCEASALRTQREDALTTAINALMEIAAVTANWAADIPDEMVLYQLVSTQSYKLRQMKVADRLERIKAIINACEAAAPGIPDNPLNAESYRNARACLKTFIDLEGAARNCDAQRIAATKQLNELNAAGTALLKRIDDMLRKFKSIQPGLHTRYKAVRNILDFGGSTKRSVNKAVKKAQQAAKKAQDAALIAAETARIADEEARNQASLAELKQSLSKTNDKRKAQPGDMNNEDAAVPLIPLTPKESTQVG